MFIKFFNWFWILKNILTFNFNSKVCGLKIKFFYLIEIMLNIVIWSVIRLKYTITNLTAFLIEVKLLVDAINLKNLRLKTFYSKFFSNSGRRIGIIFFVKIISSFICKYLIDLTLVEIVGFKCRFKCWV